MTTVSSSFVKLSGKERETKRRRLDKVWKEEEERWVLMGLVKEDDLEILGSEGVRIRVVLKLRVAIERRKLYGKQRGREEDECSEMIYPFRLVLPQPHF